jgi:CRP-like cAMP-binding protein
MLQLVRDVKKSVSSDLSMEWLKPFMTERTTKAGEVLFYKDEKADSMYYIVSGRFYLVESGIELPVGAIVGELGMLSPSNVRTQTLECVEDPGRAALCAKSCIRLLLPSSRQRPAVSKHCHTGATASAADRGHN